MAILGHWSADVYAEDVTQCNVKRVYELAHLTAFHKTPLWNPFGKQGV